MTIKDSDITVVFQGPVLEGSNGTARLVHETKKVLPRSRYILSTWIGSEVQDISVDKVILSEDPGELPGIKCHVGTGEFNNINRQMRSTQCGLLEAESEYAIKIRTDCSPDGVGFLVCFKRFYRTDSPARIVVSSMFTIDPAMFEQMPYHISDWFQFGKTTELRSYWSAPFMSEIDATYYEIHPHAPYSTFMDRRFRCRLAVEQFVATHYAKRLGYAIPFYHNDLRPDVLAGHRRFLAERFVVLDPWDLGLRFEKYQWAYHSGFQKLNCLLYVDWYQLYMESEGVPTKDRFVDAAVRRRRAQKQMVRQVGSMGRQGRTLVASAWREAAGESIPKSTGISICAVPPVEGCS